MSGQPLILIFLTLLSGGIVGFTLGLMGGGGSILATPLLLYVVEVRDVHTAIGTGAIAVSVNAYANLYGHWRKGHVWWRCALVFTAGGVVGALLGSTLGKAVDGNRLLFFFGLLMVLVAFLMRRPLKIRASSHVEITSSNHAVLAALALLVGFCSGLFGIGGGFLIVPGLMLATGMPLVNAIGSSLLAVGTFGLATALNYSLSGFIDWPIAALFVLGGILGGFVGLAAAVRLSARHGVLNRVFSAIVLAVSVYILFRSLEH